MKKSIIYLCLIALFTIGIYSSCDTAQSTERIKTEELIALENIQEYNDGTKDYKYQEYQIIQNGTDLEIIFNDFSSCIIEKISYLIDSELPPPTGQERLQLNKERKIIPCSRDVYNSINETESLFEHDNKSVHYCKKARDGDTIYRMIVIYNNNT